MRNSSLAMRVMALSLVLTPQSFAQQQTPAKTARAQEELKKQIAALRGQGFTALDKVPVEHGPARVKKLLEIVDLFEKGRNLSAQVEDERVKIQLLGDASLAHMRMIFAEDHVNRLVPAVEAADKAERAFVEAEVAFRAASGEAAKEKTRQSLDTAKAVFVEATRQVDEIKNHAQIADRLFREMISRMRQFPDMGPGYGVIKTMLALQGGMLEAKVVGEARELELLLERFNSFKEDPPK